MHGLFSVLEAVGTKVRATAIRASVTIVVRLIVGYRSPHVENAVVNESQVSVVRRGNIERHQPIVNAIEVDFNCDRLLSGKLLVPVVFLNVLAWLLVGLGLFFVRFLGLILVVGFLFILLLLLADFVAPWTERILS